MSLLRKLFIRGASGNEAEVNASNELLVNTGLTGLATSAKQDTGNNSLSSIDTKLTSQATATNQATTNSKLDTLIAKDYATQTTLAQIKAKTDNLDVALSTRTKPTDTQAVSLASVPLPTGASTSAKQDLLLAELQLKADLTDTQPVYPATQYEEYSPSDMVTVLNQNAKLTTDGSGNLNVRGSVLTDEGSFRDDFSDVLSADWTFTTTGNGTTSQATTIQTVNSGTQAGNTDIKIFTDYSPIIFKKLVQVSQRINNQTIIFGFRDNVDSPNISAEFQLSGTVNTAFNVVTSSSAVSGNSETYSQTVPNAKTTATYLEYEIQVLQNVVAFYVDGILVRTCKIHVPTTGSGSELYAFFRVENTATVTNTAINVDYVDVANMNLVEVKNEFTSKPLSVQQSGDQHHITSVFTANTTTADQNILTFTVPTNRTMYIVGLSIETSNIGGTVKIGKNTITTPSAPGTTDANMFRQFSMQNASATLDSYRAIDFGSFPRVVGSNGDVFRVLITPRGNQPSVWSTTIDYILK